jgi:hypothetical protein
LKGLVVNDAEDVLGILVSVLALGIFAIALVAYRRRPTSRTLLITGAFGVYVLKGVFLALDVTNEADRFWEEFWEYWVVLADVLFLLLIAWAFLKR